LASCRARGAAREAGVRSTRDESRVHWGAERVRIYTYTYTYIDLYIDIDLYI